MFRVYFNRDCYPLNGPVVMIGRVGTVSTVKPLMRIIPNLV
ncbi:hypothetical protein ACMFWY_16840 [Roseiconus sp. JC912]